MIKRRRVLIDRTFQLRLASELMVIVLIVPLVLWADFYLLAQYAKTVDVAQGRQLNGFMMMGALIQKQWWLMALLYLVNFSLVYFLIVYYSHRIAGPVYRFSTVLGGMANGQLNQRINLRKNDYFENLGDSINSLSRSLVETIDELKDATSKLADNGDTEVKELASAMSDILARYETQASTPEDSESERKSKSDEEDANLAPE